MWSYAAFLEEGELLVARAQQCEAREAAVWRWRHGRRPHLPGNSFLVSRDNVRRRKRVSASGAETLERGFGESSELEDINSLLEEDLDDDGELSDNSVLQMGNDDADTAETVLYEFHIVFHAVYQTPVLYFRVTQLDGAPVTFDATAARDLHLPGGNTHATLVAMEHHQVLGTPFYMLHPCETAAAMALLLDQSRLSLNDSTSHSTSPASSTVTTTSSKPASPSYLLAWLSLVQPLTQLNPLMY